MLNENPNESTLQLNSGQDLSPLKTNFGIQNPSKLKVGYKHGGKKDGHSRSAETDSYLHSFERLLHEDFKQNPAKLVKKCFKNSPKTCPSEVHTAFGVQLVVGNASGTDFLSFGLANLD